MAKRKEQAIAIVENCFHFGKMDMEFVSKIEFYLPA